MTGESSARIRHALLDEILAHARSEAPLECCGLLLGRAGRIEESVRARNALASRTRFLIEPEDHFAALRHARQLGLEILGAYHSHPRGDAVPSPRDLDEATDPELLHLIVGLPQGTLRAYRLSDRNFRLVELVPFT